MLVIEAVEYCVPGKRLQVEQDREHFNLDPEKARVFKRIYGLNEIPCASDIPLCEFIQNPIEKILNHYTIPKENIKYLIHAHTSKVLSFFGHSVIRDVQSHLGLKEAIAFGTSLNNCASALNALEIAGLLLADESPGAQAIVVTGEMAFTPSVQVIPNSSLMGDASAAILVAYKGDKNRLLHLEMHTDGRFSKGIWLEKSEMAEFEKSYAPTFSCIIENCVKKTGLKLSDIKMIFPHNVNLISWAQIARLLNFDLKKIYLKNVTRYAHCFGSDIFMNYADAYKEGCLEEGDYFVMATAGLGATYAAAVFQH